MQFQISDTTIRINVASRAALEECVRARLAAGRGFALATLNLDHLVKLRQQADFRAAYAAQDWVVADGNPVVWLSRLARKPVELVPGADMVVPLARLAAEADVGVALCGSTSDVLDVAAARLQAQVPGLRITARIAPPFGFDPAGTGGTAALNDIAVSGARLCFLALGAPKQEILAARGREICPQVGFASIGAGLDFIAGAQRRAPVWVRRIAMEWAWRMGQQPRRLIQRYVQCAAVLPGAARAALRQRRAG